MKGEENLFDPHEIERILIRSTNWLGDAVMTTPAIGAIRASFPNAHITILATPLVAELFLTMTVSMRSWSMTKRTPRRPCRATALGTGTRARRFDMAILLQNALDAAFITWLARVPVRMGYRTDGRGLLLTLGCPVTEERNGSTMWFII